MTKADNDKSQENKPHDDVIEGDATIIEETKPTPSKSASKASSKEASKAASKGASKAKAAKIETGKSSSSAFPKLAFAALILAILSLAASLYMGLMMGALKTELASHKTALESVQNKTAQSQIETQDSLVQSTAKIEALGAKLGSDFKILETEFNSLKNQIADRDKTSSSPSSASLELSVVMMIWAQASGGERLDRFAPIVESLPASQTKTSLIDILSLAGDSTHESLMIKAMTPSKKVIEQAEDKAPSGVLDSFTSWFGDFVKLRPVEAPSGEAILAEKQRQAAAPSLTQTQEMTSLESLYAHLSQSDMADDDLASWLIEAKARLEADKALTSLLQTLIRLEIKG